MADKATVQEIETFWSLKHLAMVHQMLDIQEEADFHYQEKSKKNNK